MIIKGGQRGKGRELATHLLRTDTNESVALIGTWGVVGRDVKSAMSEIEAVASGGRSSKPLYHVSISPEIHERLTREQWIETADRLGAALGLEGHQRLMVLHTKEGRQHAHVVWNRVDAETLKVAHHSHNYRVHEEVARVLEREFGLNRTQGVHAEVEGPRPERKRSKTKESQQEARTGWRKEDAREAIGTAWHAADNGEAFCAALADQGYRLARGDTRDFVVIDPAGGIHSIRSGVPGVRVADIRERLGDLDPASLPSASEAQKAARESWAAGAPGLTKGPVRPAPTAQLTGPRSVRPTQPEPGRYEALGQVTSPTPKPARSSLRPWPAPQPRPTPPTWAREAPQPKAPLAQPQPPPPPLPPQRPPPPMPVEARHRTEITAMKERQTETWERISGDIRERHERAKAELEAHHEERLATLTIDVDRRLTELNGLTSRAGALIDRSERDREIAYLVAKRQRMLVDEKDRQDRVRADLTTAQRVEVSEARGQHERHNNLQRIELEKRHDMQRHHGPEPSSGPSR